MHKVVVVTTRALSEKTKLIISAVVQERDVDFIVQEGAETKVTVNSAVSLTYKEITEEKLKNEVLSIIRDELGKEE